MAQWADGIHVGIHDTKTVSHPEVRYRILMLEPMVGLEPTTCCLRSRHAAGSVMDFRASQCGIANRRAPQIPQDSPRTGPSNRSQVKWGLGATVSGC